MFGFDVRDRDVEEEKAWRQVWDGEAGAGGDDDEDEPEGSSGEDGDSLWEAEVAVLAISAPQRAAK
jgi:hypothetical protein